MSISITHGFIQSIFKLGVIQTIIEVLFCSGHVMLTYFPDIVYDNPLAPRSSGR